MSDTIYNYWQGRALTDAQEDALTAFYDLGSVGQYFVYTWFTSSNRWDVPGFGAIWLSCLNKAMTDDTPDSVQGVLRNLQTAFDVNDHELRQRLMAFLSDYLKK